VVVGTSTPSKIEEIDHEIASLSNGSCEQLSQLRLYNLKPWHVARYITRRYQYEGIICFLTQNTPAQVRKQLVRCLSTPNFVQNLLIDTGAMSLGFEAVEHERVADEITEYLVWYLPRVSLAA
jgi:hypothetical protein